MKKLLLMLCLCLFGLTTFATTQQSDLLIYKGKNYRLYSNPLDAYFKAHPDKKPKSSIIMTSLWRGYLATFELIDQQLYVIDIEILTADGDEKPRTGRRSVFQEVFPDQERVKVDWLNDVIASPTGKEIIDVKHSIHGFASKHKAYTLFVIQNGDLKEVKTMKLKEYEIHMHQVFKELKTKYNILLSQRTNSSNKEGEEES